MPSLFKTTFRVIRQNPFPCALLSAMLFFAACDQDTVVPTPPEPEPEPEPEIIYFTGVSLTDENGQAMSSPDTTDWRLDDEWTAAEKALFPAAPENTCAAADSMSLWPAYPNPAGNVLGLSLNSQAGKQWDFRLVDQDLNPVLSLDGYTATGGSNSFHLNLSSVTVKDTLRLYYQVQLNNGCTLRGHGDLIRQ